MSPKSPTIISMIVIYPGGIVLRPVLVRELFFSVVLFFFLNCFIIILVIFFFFIYFILEADNGDAL